MNTSRPNSLASAPLSVVLVPIFVVLALACAGPTQPTKKPVWVPPVLATENVAVLQPECGTNGLCTHRAAYLDNDANIWYYYAWVDSSPIPTSASPFPAGGSWTSSPAAPANVVGVVVTTVAETPTGAPAADNDVGAAPDATDAERGGAEAAYSSAPGSVADPGAALDGGGE